MVSTQFIVLIPAQTLEDQERNLYGNTFHYSDGTSKTVIFNDFVNFFNGTDWEHINPNIVISNDPLYDFMVSKGIYEVYFKVDPTTSEMVKFWYNSSRKNEHPHKSGFLTLQPRALKYVNDLSQIQVINMPQAVVGLPLNNSLVYPNIYEQGINLSFSYNPSALKQHLTLQNNDTLPAPLQYIIDGGNVTLDIDFEIVLSNFLDVYINNTKLEKNQEKRVESGNIELRLENETVFSFNKVFAYDSNKSAVFGDFNIKTYGNFQNTRKIRLTMKIPYDFLLKENLQYPIFIDPTITVLRPSGAGFIASFPHQAPAMESGTDLLYLDGLEGSNDWSLNGVSPYLDALDNPTNMIYTDIQGALSYDFTFEDTTYPSGATILLNRLSIYSKGDGNDAIWVYVWDGNSWNGMGFILPELTFDWDVIDVSGVLNTRAKQDASKVYFRYDKTGASHIIEIDYAYIGIGWEKALEHWQLVDEENPDGDTTSVWTSETDSMIYSELYNIPDFTLPVNNTIEQIEVFNHVKSAVYIEGYYPKLYVAIRTYDTAYFSPLIPVTSGTYHNQSYVWATNPNTMLEWTENEIDNLQIGTRGYSIWYGLMGGFHISLHVTQVWIEITFSPPVLVSIPALFIGLLTFAMMVAIILYLGLKRKQK